MDACGTLVTHVAVLGGGYCCVDDTELRHGRQQHLVVCAPLGTGPATHMLYNGMTETS
jgi:hypothetical protein